MTNKPRLGVFSVTGCFGCQLTLAFVEDILLELLDKFEIAAFPMLKQENSYENLDIAIIEGSACRQEEIEELKKIRSNAKIVVALGACANSGSVQSIIEVSDKKQVMETVYNKKYKQYNPVEVGGIDKHIKVDFHIYGCPPDKEDLLLFIKQLLAGNIKPKQVDYNVCVECRAKANPCLLQEGKFCVGALTHGGCNALCPTNGHYCFGCHGYWEDSNVEALTELFKEYGFDKQLKNILAKFDCTSKQIKQIVK